MNYTPPIKIAGPFIILPTIKSGRFTKAQGYFHLIDRDHLKAADLISKREVGDLIFRSCCTMDCHHGEKKYKQLTYFSFLI